MEKYIMLILIILVFILFNLLALFLKEKSIKLEACKAENKALIKYIDEITFGAALSTRERLKPTLKQLNEGKRTIIDENTIDADKFTKEYKRQIEKRIQCSKEGEMR